MFDETSRHRSHSESRLIRLVDDLARHQAPGPTPGVGFMTDPAPLNDLARPNGKKARKKAQERPADAGNPWPGTGAASAPDGAGPDKLGHGKKGQGKKVKSAKWLVREALRLDQALTQLRDRLSDLHSVQLDHAESNAALGGRIGSLNTLVMGERDQREALARRLEELTAAVGSLTGRLASQATGSAVADLAERLARSESALAELRSALTASLARGPESIAPQVLAQFESRLAILGETLGESVLGQGQRLDRLDLDLAELRQAQAKPMPALWQPELEQLRTDLSGRLDRLGGDLERDRRQAREGREADQARNQDRWRWLGRRQAIGALLLALLFGGLIGAQWWRTGQDLDLAAARLTTLELGPAAGIGTASESAPGQPPGQALVATAQPVMADGSQAAMGSLELALSRLADQVEGLAARRAADEAAVPPTLQAPLSQDLLERLRRLEVGLDGASRDLAANQESARSLAQQVGTLVQGQQALDRRLDLLQRDYAAADKGLAVLDVRVDALTNPPAQVQTGLADARYAIQLVAYAQRARALPFAQDHGIQEQASTLAIRVGGRPAHAVLLGDFSDEAAARVALAALPPDLRALRPWVRRLPAGARLEPLR